MASYKTEILKILTEAGQQGLPLHKIAKHVHNSCNTLFETSDYNKVYNQVKTYIKNNTGSRNSLIEKSKRGTYRINPSSSEGKQLAIDFGEKSAEQE